MSTIRFSDLGHEPHDPLFAAAAVGVSVAALPVLVLLALALRAAGWM